MAVDTASLYSLCVSILYDVVKNCTLLATGPESFVIWAQIGMCCKTDTL